MGMRNISGEEDCLECTWEMIKQMVGEFTPSDFGEKLVFSPIRVIGFILQNRVADLPGTNHAPSEVRGQSRSSVRSGGISEVSVRMNDFTRRMSDLGLPGRLRYVPVRKEFFVPRVAGEEVEIIQGSEHELD